MTSLSSYPIFALEAMLAGNPTELLPPSTLAMADNLVDTLRDWLTAAEYMRDEIAQKELEHVTDLQHEEILREDDQREYDRHMREELGQSIRTTMFGQDS